VLRPARLQPEQWLSVRLWHSPVTACFRVLLDLQTPICVNANRRMVAEATLLFVRFAVFTAATMKNGVFWDVTPCGSCKHRRFR
jgi:hypothetical protein